MAFCKNCGGTGKRHRDFNSWWCERCQGTGLASEPEARSAAFLFLASLLALAALILYTLLRK